ncbi:MAG: acyl-CoA dehydratase activase-related protein [Patescibacteria group bacterium]|nr:acyl-CoA dehydratase activase-related protein [Patescibacteria group bacterium]
MHRQEIELEPGTVGIPKALMTFDLAPLLGGFLHNLKVPMVFSTPTNKQTIEKSLELAYSETCFPVKLLHGHVAELVERGVNKILIPNAIRMGRMDGDENQRYSCPLVQASPYIIRTVFNPDNRLARGLLPIDILDPVIDLSRGDKILVKSLARIAQRKLGFSWREGLRAAQGGIEAQKQFESQLQVEGQLALEKLKVDSSALGVVLLARAYNAQDEGANLGMDTQLQKLGVVPIPMDYLSLGSVDVKKISDRPYWNYENKILAASRIIAENPQLFGIFLSNFGCGPNSFIQNIVEDIMGGKPLGQIELDEHAAEAGYITRLEAFVNTIRGYKRAKLHLMGKPENYYRSVPTILHSGQYVFIPQMSDHAAVVAAVMRSFGVEAQVLPESDERSMALSRDVTSGKECLPFRDTLGGFLRMAKDGTLPKKARALMAGSYGACRLGKYAQEQQKILRDLGIDVEVVTTVSNNAYADLGLGKKFELRAWEGILATDLLQRLLWMTRSYERQGGQVNKLYEESLGELLKLMEIGQPVEPLMRETTAKFAEARDPNKPRRPLVGINGEIYLRANRFCNKGLVEVCEANGLEAEVAPMSEWLKYITWRNLEDAWNFRQPGRLFWGTIRELALLWRERGVASWGDKVIPEYEPHTWELLKESGVYLPSRNGSEAVLSIGTGLRQMRNRHFAGVISVMPHGCMPGGIVAAFSEHISRRYNKPWISLTYDGFPDKVNLERVADLAEQVKEKAA